MKADRDASGIIFNIQKFSVHDGPGIRTTVFLKGCPLRCAWCANPESQSIKRQVLWDADKCLHCGHCAAGCRAGAIRMDEGQIHINHSLCERCGTCVSGCPGRALEWEGFRMSVREVLDVVLQDVDFYEESGGGMTLSGGEMLMQPDFSYHLLLAAKEEGIRTCCETTGQAAPDVFARVTDPADQLLFDMKHWNDQKHREGTGVSNALILENLRAAVAAGKPVLVRVPVIPGFNDSPDDAREMSALMRKTGIETCQLLPFHQFGEKKYARLGKDYRYKDVPAYHREDLQLLQDTFRECGIDAFF